MTKQSKTILLAYNKCAELATKFQNILDSFWHKDEKIPFSALEGDIDLSVGEFVTSIQAGKYAPGETVPENTSAGAQIKDMFQVPITQTFNSPKILLSSNPNISNNREIGESLNLTFSSNFTQNDGGNLTEITYFKNNIEVVNDGSGAYTTAISLTENNVNFKARASFEAGIGEKTDVLGNIYENTIIAGNVDSNQLSFRGYLPIFYNDIGDIVPNGEQIRVLRKRLVNDGNTFTMPTNASKKFLIWLPKSYNLISVIHTNINDNLTGSFVKSDMTIDDAGNGTIAGDLYLYEIDVAFNISQTFSITVASN